MSHILTPPAHHSPAEKHLRGHSLAAATAFFAMAALSLALLAPSTAFAISRNRVLARAQSWVDSPVKYSQQKEHLGYRTDCSGYVSMCWKTGTSWATSSFHLVSHTIRKSSLKPGDALLKKGYHIRLFYGWLDDAHTQYVAYESNSGVVARCTTHSIADDIAFGYKPTRFDDISNSPKSDNVLHNGTFNSWARSWGSQPEEPVWWQPVGPWGQTIVTHRKDTYRSARNSLRLSNRSGSPLQYTQLSQTATVVAGVPYRLSAYAKTPSSPSAVELNLRYLNAVGATVAETSTTGARAALTNAAFRKMTVLMRTPADAAKAVVTVRLAGQTSTNASGTVVNGSSVFLDDFSLARPRVAVTIRRSASTAYSGRKIVLSGSVAPASAVGTDAVVWIRRPGSSWKKLSTPTVYASGSAGAWKSSLTFRRSMRRGTYRFKTSVPALPGYLGATTKVVSVKFK